MTVIGGGFIGIEVMENLVEAGHKVTLVEALPQVLNQFDHEMVQILHRVVNICGLNPESIERATKDFLAGQGQEPAEQSSPSTEQNSTPSGEPASD